MYSDEVSAYLASLNSVGVEGSHQQTNSFFFLCMQLQLPESVYPPLLCNRWPISECSEHKWACPCVWQTKKTQEHIKFTCGKHNFLQLNWTQNYLPDIQSHNMLFTATPTADPLLDKHSVFLAGVAKKREPQPFSFVEDIFVDVDLLSSGLWLQFSCDNEAFGVKYNPRHWNTCKLKEFSVSFKGLQV